MKKLIAGATVIACMFLSSAAFAKEHGRGEGKGKERERVEGRWDRDRDRGDHRRDIRWGRDHDRDDRRPAGWDKGKKKGWGDCDVPPGQAKKQGCYDRDRRYRHTRRITRRYPATHRDPVVGVWQRNKQTTTTTSTRTGNTGTWRRPPASQQTTTTTTTTQPAPTNGTWRK